MEATMNTDEESSMYSSMKADSPARTQPCSRACTHSAVRPGRNSDKETDAKSASRKTRCPLGFSEMQIAILSILKTSPPVIAYWQLAEALSVFGLNVSEGAVRGALTRLFKYGFLVRGRAARGRMQGNRYAFTSDPCPYIIPYRDSDQSGMDSVMDSPVSYECNNSPSLFKEKTVRNSVWTEQHDRPGKTSALEHLTEQDLAFHWPNLFRQGFGTCQIRQIVQRLTQIGMGTERVIQGLTHAEWELEHGIMRDKNNEPVASPVNWVFSCLARTGYYRRPQGYVSPEEQAELDAAEEEERQKLVRESRRNSAFEAWLSGLSPEEKSAVTAPKGHVWKIPEDTALRLHFFSNVWPLVLAGHPPEGQKSPPQNLTEQ